MDIFFSTFSRRKSVGREEEKKNKKKEKKELDVSTFVWMRARAWATLSTSEISSTEGTDGKHQAQHLPPRSYDAKLRDTLVNLSSVYWNTPCFSHRIILPFCVASSWSIFFSFRFFFLFFDLLSRCMHVYQDTIYIVICVYNICSIQFIHRYSILEQPLSNIILYFAFIVYVS